MSIGLIAILAWIAFIVLAARFLRGTKTFD